MTFLRQIDLLLPSAFLLGALLFLLTHGRSDPGFGVYPLYEQIAGADAASQPPEARFLAQAGLLFLPAYVGALLFVWLVTLAESALFGRRPLPAPSSYRRALGMVFPLLFVAASGVLVLWGAHVAARVAPDTLLAPALTAFAPFAAAAVALAPAALLAAPLALIRKAGEA